MEGQGGQRATADPCDRFQGQRGTENRRRAGAFGQGIQRVGALVHQHAPEPSSFPAREFSLETLNLITQHLSSPCTAAVAGTGGL